MGNFYTDKNGVLRNTDDDAEYEVKNGKIVKKKKKSATTPSSDIAPIDNRKWYQKGHFEDGYNFGDVTKTILGVEDKKTLKTFTAPETDLTLEELKQKKDYLDGRTWNTAEQYADALEYTKQYNQMALYQYADTLSKTQMDGQSHTVLEEIEIIANLKSGKEKDKRKDAVLKKMEELGIDTAFYPHFAGDGEFDFKNFGKWLYNASFSGLASFNKGLLDTADVILGAPLKALGWENNPISKGAEYYGTVYDTYKHDADLYAEKLGGGAWNFGSEAVEGTTGALPNAILMFMTGGASATATTSSLTTQSAMQTGNWLTKTGLTVESMMKNPQYWMSFSRTLGSDYKEAKELGASDAAATVGSVLKSMVNSGIEIGLDGGSGIQGLDDALKNGGKPFYEWVESSLEEGGEEMLQKFVGEVINKAGYGSDEEILNPIEYAKEGALGIISGAALGGGQTAVQSGVNAFNEHEANKLTDLEKSVKDKVVESRIAEKEKDGTKLTAKEKADIEKEVENKLRKGYLSADEVESVLGGDGYSQFKIELDKFKTSDDLKAFNEAKKKLEALQSEHDTIGKKTDANLIEQARFNDIRNEMAQIETKKGELNKKLSAEADRILGIRNQMRSQVMGVVKDSRLAESYRELARKSQKYEADVEQYEGKAKETVQNIIDSGLGDNSNQFHELVDFLAKISNDKGVTFNFTKTELLKGTKHYKEGYITNGFVDDNGNVVLNKDSNNAIHTIVGHEVTHVLEQTDSYKTLQAAVRDYCIAKEGLEKYNARLKAAEEAYKGKKNTTPEGEVTADIVGEYLFTDSEFVNKLSIDDRSTFMKIYDEIKYLWKVATAGSHEKRELERVKKIFDKAWRENVKGKAEDTQHSYSSIANSLYGTEGISTEEFEAMFDKDKHLETEFYQKYEAQCLSNMRQTMDNFDEHKAKVAIRKQFNGIMRVAVASKKAGYDISDIRSVDGENVALEGIEDSKNRKLFSSLEPNSDYFTSHDISTICDKRKNFAEIYDEIVRREEALGVPEDKRFFNNVSNYFAIHDIMAKQGLTTPCRQCYVESMRKNLAPMAKSFLELVGELDENNISNAQLYHQKGKNKGELKTNNAELRKAIWETLEAHPEYNLSVSDLTVEMLSTEDGLAQLRIQAPLIYEAFNSFYGQAKPKMPKSPTPFRFGELTAMLTDDKGKIKPGLVKKINSTGGFRFQSYSDFQIQNYVDVLQALFEAGTLGLNGHSYTKVPAFLDATEGTNLKRNISIFMYKDGNEWKLDRNDSFPYSLDEIYKLVEADKMGNTSIIAVSQNNEMSAWIMANDLVGYGIPFHKSGLAMATVRDTIVKEGGREIKGYRGIKDHTKQQTEVWKSTAYKENGEIDHKAGTKVKNGISIYEIDWDFENKGNLSKKELIEKNLKTYIDECEKLGYIPKFRDYVMNNSKVLDDVLRFSKELGFVSEDATIEDISFSYKGYQIPYGYYKFLGDFGMFTPNGKAAPQKPLSLENYDFDKAVEFFADAASLRRNEILQQFSNGQVREEMRESDLTTEELADIVSERRKAVADEAVQHSFTKDSAGNDLTAEQQEFFKDSQMRDEDGRLKPMYHGSQNAGFHTFNNRFSDDGQSFFFVDSNEVAESYSGTDETYSARAFRKADDFNKFFAEIGADEYEVVEEGGKFILMDDGDEIATSENADEIYEEFKDYSGLGDGSANYKTYLNIKNPFKVDAMGKSWDELPGFERKYEYIKILDTSGAKPKIEYSLVGDPAPTVVEADIDEMFDGSLANMLSNMAPGEELYGAEANPTTTREYAKYAKENGYDGVIFENIRDIGQYMTGDVATVAVVFDSNQIKSVANTKPTADPDIRYSLTKDTKQEAYHNYLDAVNNGDTDTAQKLMDDFAKDAGYNYRGVHRSFSEFTVFDREKIGSNAGTRLGDGFYVTLEFKDDATQQYADSAYGENRMDLYVKMESPLVLGSPIDENIVNKMEEDFSEFGWFGDDSTSYYAVTPEKIKKIFQSNDGYEQMETIRLIANRNHMEISELLKQYGFDSVIDENDYVKQAVVFDESQLKSAEPITYDEHGDVIMPYERFDPNNVDIRFSLSPEGEEPGYGYVPSRDIGVNDEFAPIRETVAENATVEDIAPETPSIAPEEPEKTTTVSERVQQKIDNTQAELDKNRELREDSLNYYDEEIAKKQAEYDSKKNKNSLTAQGILRSIERLKRLRANSDADYSRRISDLEKRVERYHSQEYSRAEHRREKMSGYTKMWEDLIGDTSTWKDMPLGVQYKTKTLRRILRNVVRGVDGKADIQLADDIYDELETKYDHNEASLKKESIKLKSPFEELKLTSEEDVYAQMLGELRHNPETTLSEDVVKEYYEKHKKKINPQKVDKAIEEARKLYDDLIVRVNEVLKEHGFKEIPYRKGYFPHFTNPKQTWWMKALNWKPIDTEIPTSIAGLTETFKPQRSWQKFDKHRYGDQTDYSLYKGLDTYVHGALDWIYHIEDLQKRRALENHLRYIHSDEGIQKRIEEIKNGDYDADEAQDMINAVQNEARNPLSGLVRELMNRTNTLANKKAAADRAVEDDTNRKIYSTLTNINNRVSANMVVGSLSSALTNFIPMVQSWHEVSPVYTVRGLGDMVRSTIKDDGMVEKSDFLTNRLRNEENLYKTGWDKAIDKMGFLMEAVDNITAQTVWRSKYLQNLSEGMSESAAIKDADQFAKNVMAGRSRGNMPTAFDAKNPVNKLFTAFQLEVANQYGYMFNDAPKDSKNKARLVKGYATAFLGAYAYNALYSALVGRDAAFDPIGIIEDLMRGLFDDEEEDEDVLMDFGKNILQEVPFIGGLFGGGRVPIQSAIPYSGDSTPFKSMLNDFEEGNKSALAKEFLKPLYYLALPAGGGQVKKTIEGLSMYAHPIDGSYTDSGKLRFPVEDHPLAVAQAALFGQYSSKNARDYFDNDWAPLAEKQITEYSDLGMDFKQYHKIRDGLKDYDTLAEQVNYINSLDISDEQKNILVNNLTDRKTPIDMSNYGEYGDLEEYDFAQKNPGKYAIAKVYGYDQYKAYTNNISNISGTKDSNGKTISGSRKAKVFQYINSLPLSKEEKMLLFKSEYPADDSYNREILEWLDSMYSLDDIKTMLEELGFHVYNGTVTWD